MPRPVVVFDGDDTLWFVEELYDTARSEAAELVARDHLDAQRYEDLQREIDVSNVERFGFSPERFPTSSVDAYRLLVKESGRTSKAEVEAAIWETTAAVFDARAPMAPEARRVLCDLRSHYEVHLVTKGDERVQAKRIRDSGLADVFDGTWIVNSKDVSTFRDVLDAADATPDRAWSVGNSLPSDINPALECGMSAIWIDAHVWAHERREVVPRDGRLVIVDSLRDAHGVLLAHADSVPI